MGVETYVKFAIVGFVCMVGCLVCELGEGEGGGEMNVSTRVLISLTLRLGERSAIRLDGFVRSERSDLGAARLDAYDA